MAILVRGAKLLTLDPQTPVLEHGALLIEGERIVAVGSYADLSRSDQIEQEWGSANSWILPGFVNAHYHSWRTFSMGATPDAPLEIFMLRMSGLEIPSSEAATEFHYLNTLVSACQLIHSGVTLTVDMSLAVDHRPAIQAYLDLGLDLIYAPTARTQLGYVYIPDDEFLATIPADLCKRLQGQGLGLTGGYQDPHNYWQNWLELKSDFADRIQLILAPDGPEWCSPEELEMWHQRAIEHQTYLHLHNSESPMELQWGLQTQHKTPSQFLADLGFLGANVSFGHGVWFSSEDIDLLARHGCTAVHCPTSNLRLFNGIAPVSDYLIAGLNVALGTDGQGLADTSDFLTEMQLAGLLQRTPGIRSTGLSAWQVFQMATVNGAKAFGRSDVGTLQVGQVANVVIVDGEQLQTPYLWSGYDPYLAALQRLRSTSLDSVICRGQMIMQQGQIKSLDEGSITRRLQALYETLWQEQSGHARSLVQELEPYLIRFYDEWEPVSVQPRRVYNRL